MGTACLALSRRLAALAALLPATESLADIGTDHAALLSALVRGGKIQRGIGVEVATGPLHRARANVAGLSLERQIEIRLGDGLSPLSPGEADACAIAGLGGKTIIGILARHPRVAERFTYLLLQPMTGQREVRLYLQGSGWRIVKEALVEDRKGIYLVLLAQRGLMLPMSENELAFGPILLKERPPLFVVALKEKIRHTKGIIAQLGRSDTAQSRQKIARLAAQVEEWEKLLE